MIVALRKREAKSADGLGKAVRRVYEVIDRPEQVICADFIEEYLGVQFCELGDSVEFTVDVHRLRRGDL